MKDFDNDNESKIEFENIENFSQGERQFSHQTLVMKCMNKCIELGSVEMKEGYFETKVDKRGNIMTTYTPDSRRAFIEAVKTLKAIMACDFDDEAIKILKKHMGDVTYNKEYWLKKEDDWWLSLSKLERPKWQHQKGYHNQKLHFKDDSLYDEVDIWRDILEELNKLTKRLDFYESTKFEG
jgi:hypothetical protein